jgi:hypothetical protein
VDDPSIRDITRVYAYFTFPPPIPLRPAFASYSHAVITRRGEGGGREGGRSRASPVSGVRAGRGLRDYEGQSRSRFRDIICALPYPHVFAPLPLHPPVLPLRVFHPFLTLFVADANSRLHQLPRATSSCTYVGRARINSFLGNHRPEVVRRNY